MKSSKTHPTKYNLVNRRRRMMMLDRRMMRMNNT